MKKLLAVLFASSFLFACTSSKQATTTPKEYVVLNEGGKVLKGYINRSLIENDPEFSWFKNNMKYGSADANAVAAFQKNASKFQMV